MTHISENTLAYHISNYANKNKKIHPIATLYPTKVGRGVWHRPHIRHEGGSSLTHLIERAVGVDISPIKKKKGVIELLSRGIRLIDRPPNVAHALPLF